MDLVTGVHVSISPKISPDLSTAAVIVNTPPGVLRLGFPVPVEQWPFEQDDLISVKCIDPGTLYCWTAQIVEVENFEEQTLLIRLLDEGVTVQQRRSVRVKSEIPLSFTIISSADTALIGKSVEDSWISDLSVGGLKFETDLPLTVGDKLEVHLKLENETIHASGWVARNDPIDGTGGESVSALAVEFIQLEGKDQIQLMRLLLKEALQDSQW